MAEPAKAAAPPAPKLIPMKGEDGDIRLYTPDEAKQVVAAGGSKASPEEVRAQKLQAEYGGIGGQFASAGLGAADTATLGLSNPIAVALGANRQTLADYQEANPNAYTAGQVAGFVPSLLTGGEGAIGKVASVLSAPVRGVGALGGLAERGVASVIGREAEGLGARMLQRGVAAGAGGAAEGAVYGVGQQISEATLQDHELTAERLLAGAKGGALFGAVAGGAMGAGGEALATGGRKLISLADDQLQAPGGLRNMLRGEAEGQAFKSTGAQLRDYQKLGTTAEEQTARAQSIGRTLLDEDIVSAGASKSEIATKLQAKVSQVGDELGAMRKKLDKASVRPSTSNIVEEVRAKVLDPLTALPGTEHEVAAVSKYLDSFVAKAGEAPSFETLHKFRKALDDKLYIQKASLVVDPATEQLRKVRGIIEGEFERSGEAAAQELGGSFLEKYTTTKDLYSKLITAEKISTKSVARQSANRSISLTDTISGGSGGTAGAIIGSAVGGLGGGIVGHALGGLASGMANKAVREYGNQVAADALNRATRLQAIQRAAHRTEDELTQGVAKFLSSAKKASVEVPRAAATAVKAEGSKTWSRENYDRITSHVAELKNNTDLHQARLANETDEIGTVAPNVATAIGITSTRAVQYLSANTPPSLAPPSKITPLVPRAIQKTLTLDEMKFMRKAQAVEDPKGTILRGLESNSLSLDSVQAIEAVYPSLYKDLQRIVGDAAAQRKKPEEPLDTDVLYRLGLITGTKTHFSQEPGFVSAVQATKEPPKAEPDTAAQAPQQPAPPVPVPPHAIQMAQQMMTPTEEIQTP